MGNGHVVTLINDKEYDFIVSLSDVAMLFDLKLEDLIDTILSEGSPYHSSNNMVIVRKGIQYFTGIGFIEFEKTISNTINSGVVERIVKWIRAAQFDTLPSSHFDVAFNVAEDVVDLERWEREMLLLLVEVDNGELRRKLVAKIKEVI